MDIFDYLKKDHQKVSRLFSQFKEAVSDVQRRDIVTLIIEELNLHAESEQNTFYKALEAYPSMVEEIKHAEKEHNDINIAINEILEMNQLNKEWKNKVLELEFIVDHHVSEEEDKIFHEAKKVLSKEEAYELKEQMHYYKDQLLEQTEVV